LGLEDTQRIECICTWILGCKAIYFLSHFESKESVNLLEVCRVCVIGKYIALYILHF
jgi:hypothetical protein